jgi:hypothetical protein
MKLCHPQSAGRITVDQALAHPWLAKSVLNQ